MRLGIVGAGRMGKILAQSLSKAFDVVIFDSNTAGMKKVSAELGLSAVESLTALEVERIILAVPDGAVRGCVEELTRQGVTASVFNVATNTSRDELAAMAGDKLRCLNVKIIGHAGEMERGAEPAIVVDEGETETVQQALEIFQCVGCTLVGDADAVRKINICATEAALKAAVALEEALCNNGIADPRLIKAALSQVATGVLRAYAEDDLGPFAWGIVCALRDKSDGKMV